MVFHKKTIKRRQWINEKNWNRETATARYGIEYPNWPYFPTLYKTPPFFIQLQNWIIITICVYTLVYKKFFHTKFIFFFCGGIYLANVSIFRFRMVSFGFFKYCRIFFSMAFLRLFISEIQSKNCISSQCLWQPSLTLCQVAQ